MATLVDAVGGRGALNWGGDLAMDFFGCKATTWAGWHAHISLRRPVHLARAFVIACVPFSPGFHFLEVAHGAESEIISVRQYGAWNLFCQKNDAGTSGDCALVQNVSGSTPADPEAWVKSSLDLTRSGALVLSLRFDHSILAESGVAIRIDDKLIGVSPFFRCDQAYCKTSIELASKNTLNEIGAAVELGKQMYVDFRMSEDSGYRLSLGLDGVKDGILALYSSAKAQFGLNNEIVEAPSNSIVGPFGISSTEKAVFRVEARELSDLAKANTESVSYSELFAQPCATSDSDNSTTHLTEVVAVSPDLTVGDNDKVKIKTLVERAKKCKNNQYFIVIWDPARSGHTLETESGVHRLEQLQIAHAITEAGVSNGNVFFGSGPTVNAVLPLRVHPKERLMGFQTLLDGEEK